MPLSTAGILSSSPATSSRSRNRPRYRTKALSSQVDESLFGVIKPLTQSDSPIVLLRDKHAIRKTLTPLGLDHKPETIQLITHDMVRELIGLVTYLAVSPAILGVLGMRVGMMRGKEESRAACHGAKSQSPSLLTLLIPCVSVPTKDSSGKSLIMIPEEFERTKWASQILTREELEAREQAFKKEKEAIVDAVTTRKKIMKQKEMVWRKNKKLSDLEEVAKERAQNLLQRATQLRMEQEEELKDVSKIILNAKCHAIRDAQILEKQLIQKELDAEEKRLDQMMEVERQKSIQRQEELDRKRKEERIRGRQYIVEQMEKNQVPRGRRYIVEQMEKNQEERSLLAEQREQEKEQMLEYLEQLQEEDLRDLERRHQQKLKMQAEIKRINEENQKQKAELLAQEKLADQMVMEFTRKKMAREAEFEAEQERIRREKEKEIARLRALQEKAQDYQAEQDALRAKRNQEVADREWRRKEKENAQKKMETEAKLRKSRLEQVAFKEHALAVQVQRDRDEFERILRAQREQIEKEQLEEEKKATGRLQHANELRRQVRENQQRQVQDRIATFEEGRRLKEEAQKRRERIEDIKKKKLEELRTAVASPGAFLTFSIGEDCCPLPLIPALLSAVRISSPYPVCSAYVLALLSAVRINGDGQEVLYLAEGDNVRLGCPYILDPEDYGPNGLDIEWMQVNSDPSHRENVFLSYQDKRINHGNLPHLQQRVRFAASDPSQYDASITLTNLQVSDTATYECRVKKTTMATRRVIVTVQARPAVPLCWSEGHMTSGNDVVLKCFANGGSPPLSYRWAKISGHTHPYRAGSYHSQHSFHSELSYQESFHSSVNQVSGLNNGDLVLKDISHKDNGLYQCTVANHVGYSVCVVEVKVSDTRRIGIIIGAVLGSLLILACLLVGIAGLICCCCGGSGAGGSGGVR
ncbi:coiled-coil domain-containing protein 19, mitochondrial [Camelus ferus]|nr:coiled-coil domain-containing protein 19, mitochondrial [Camelus ferus]